VQGGFATFEGDIESVIKAGIDIVVV
jgi:hypothetical protein